MDRITLLNILRWNFAREWSDLKGNPHEQVRDFLYLIEEAFLIDDMMKSLNSKLLITEGLTNRYHSLILRSLSRQFAVILFQVSQEGKNVNPETIRKAQEILKAKGECQIMPCTKPKS